MDLNLLDILVSVLAVVIPIMWKHLQVKIDATNEESIAFNTLIEAYSIGVLVKES